MSYRRCKQARSHELTAAIPFQLPLKSLASEALDILRLAIPIFFSMVSWVAMKVNLTPSPRPHVPRPLKVPMTSFFFCSLLFRCIRAGHRHRAPWTRCDGETYGGDAVRLVDAVFRSFYPRGVSPCAFERSWTPLLSEHLGVGVHVGQRLAQFWTIPVDTLLCCRCSPCS